MSFDSAPSRRPAAFTSSMKLTVVARSHSRCGASYSRVISARVSQLSPTA